MELPLPTADQIAALPPDGGPTFNRLVHEKSPYLLEHARNPVDWYPWGEEAFAAARRAGKPVFLSVGYSTCHWCHVMARESFEREDVAAILNARYIAIKVDREERPDIDTIYMHATQGMTGRGGWPNSVWLTPDRKPWYAGNYFPPEDATGRSGFKTVLTLLADTWDARRDVVERHADQAWRMIEQMAGGAGVEARGALTRDLVRQAVNELHRSFDQRWGGFFRSAPKFPPHASLALLLAEHERTADAALLRLATRTLDAMARGGIHDHVGGGFHRYSTDARWFLPHFEKMLYDNAQLSRAFVEAYRLTGEEEYRRTATGTYEWVLREMTDPGGGFYAALDADSEGEEGRFYLWRPGEVMEVLGHETGELVCRLFGVREGGNFREEASGEEVGANVLSLAKSLAECAQDERLPVAELRSRVDAALQALRERRAKRVRPHRDDKILTSWNGLMIGSLAAAGRVLGEERYVAAARRAADFTLERLRRDGRLLRSYRDGTAKIEAFLDDHAFLADGLLELAAATGEGRYRREAQRLMDELLERFWDRVNGGFFFTTAGGAEGLLRPKSGFDQAVPAGNGVAARVLVRLGLEPGGERYLEHARRTFEAFLGAMEQAPAGTETLIGALALYFDRAATAAAPADPGAREARAPAASVRRGALTVDAFLPEGRVAPGATCRVDLRLTIETGWHLQATVVERENEPVAVAGLPASCEGIVWIRCGLAVPAAAPTGLWTVPLSVRFQACDDSRCLAPDEARLALPIPVVAVARAAALDRRESSR